MYLSDIVQKNIPFVSPEDKVTKALEIVTTHQLTHVVVVEHKKLVGLLTEECLWTMEEDDQIQNGNTHFQEFYLESDNQLLETFKVFRMNDTNVIPVLDNNAHYTGVVTMEEVVYDFSYFPFLEERGALMDIEVSLTNYSMAEISRLVESNNSKLFGAIITAMDAKIVQVTLKLSSENISSVGETFERYGYVVKQKYYIDKKEELLDERYKQLQKYLDL